ncbi:MAG: GNAT family N-acetyltransferase [Candidatus Hodarchaeota archaeon]
MKIIELEFKEFSKVHSIFKKTLHLIFTIDAVLAGNSPGRIWVDQFKDPKSAFLWDKAHCYYFTGNPGNTNFNSAIKELFSETIIPYAIANHRDIYKIEYASIEWEPILDELLKKTPPIKSARVFYGYKNQKKPERSDIPLNDFIIQKIDKQLLNSTIKNVDSIIDEINQCWNSIDEFLTNGFGFCLIHKPTDEDTSVQGWCTGEYFSDSSCGIGIKTFKEYQGRGFATAMASTFVEHCLSVNIRPHWDASASNQVSRRVAEKVGFEKIQNYTVLFGSFTKNDR